MFTEDLQCLHVDLNADSVESFYMPSSSLQDPTTGGIRVVACGTYQLIPEENRRIGRLHLYSLSSEDAPQLSELAKQDSDFGILDMYCCASTSNDNALIYAATAGGTIDCYEISSSANDFSVDLKYKHDITAECNTSNGDVICLAVDGCRDTQQLVTSTNTGHLCFVDTARQQTYLSFCGSDDGHELWTCAFDKQDPAIVYSGGDDCRFKIWDQRSIGDKQSPSPIFKSKRYSMGITCIQKHPQNQHLLAVGSYDEQLRLFDTRNLSRPLCVEETKLSGGVWRIKFHPSRPLRLVCACMHGGYDVVNLTSSGDSRLESKHTFTKYESLAYGVDWVSTDGDADLIASCSFYDNQLRLWSINDSA